MLFYLYKQNIDTDQTNTAALSFILTNSIDPDKMLLYPSKEYTVYPVISDHSKIDKTKILMTDVN